MLKCISVGLSMHSVSCAICCLTIGTFVFNDGLTYLLNGKFTNFQNSRLVFRETRLTGRRVDWCFAFSKDKFTLGVFSRKINKALLFHLPAEVTSGAKKRFIDKYYLKSDIIP